MGHVEGCIRVWLYRDYMGKFPQLPQYSFGVMLGGLRFGSFGVGIGMYKYSSCGLRESE